MEHKTKEPKGFDPRPDLDWPLQSIHQKARLTKRSTVQEIKECLQHAARHCRYGTNADKTIRNPTLTDCQAASMLESIVLNAFLDKG